MVGRLFQLYYDLCYAHVLSKKTWVDLLNPDATETNWFVRHRKTFGYWKWSIRYLIAYAAFFGVVTLYDRARGVMQK